MSRSAIFLDRDGTVIEDRDYPNNPDEVRLIPEAVVALRRLAGLGWPLFIVSNQSGVGRGLITPSQKEAVHERCLALLEAEGIRIEGSYFCPHTPDERCPCRKPSPYMLQLAAREHGLDLAKSWMIGDREGDFLCGRNAGCRSLWLRNAAFPGGAADWCDVSGIIAGDNEIS